MRPEPDYLNPLRIGAVAVCGLSLLELGLFLAIGLPVSFPPFAASLVLGLLAAAAWWAGLLLFKKYSGHPGDPSRVTALAVALALLFLILADWFAAELFNHGHPARMALALAILLVIIIALGRMLYLYFPMHGNDLAKARFQALAPVAVVDAALYSAAENLHAANRLPGDGFALTVLVLILLLVAGQYAGIRMIWGGRRDKWRRAGLRIQYLLFGATIVVLTLLWLRPFENPSADRSSSFLLPRAGMAIIENFFRLQDPGG